MKLYQKIIWGSLFLLGVVTVQGQTASFNFSLSSHPVTGWVNVSGDPSTAVRTGVSGSIQVSSVATSNWAQYNAVAAFDGGGMTGASFFPAGVMVNMWFQYSTFFAAYNAAVPQLLISGLSIDSVYTLQMSASFNTNTFDFNPTRYTVTGANVYGFSDVNVDSNLTAGAVFNNVAPDSNGNIRIYVNTVNGSNTAGISGIRITSGRNPAPVPSIALTNPLNNTIIPEDGNVVISATASESGGTISVVEFYAGSVKIGSAASAPYSMTWHNPDEGSYTITARAIDGLGNINTASAKVSVESLSSFWSMTGNIHMNPDSNFVGNVDSVRLAFRTKDIERMSISPTGNVGIGTIAPTTQLHTTGSVRLAGLSNDSAGADTRLVVSDTGGKLFYRSMPGNTSLTIGGGLGQTASGAIAIGDSIPGFGPHSFLSNRYQYLNGHFYSIGGSVNDPVNSPDFRIYNNGDLAAGTTMDSSVNTNLRSGLRYNAGLGLLQLGASDRLNTNSPNSFGAAILLNSDSTNMIKGDIENTILAADKTIMDSGTNMANNFVGTEGSHFGVNTFLGKSLFGGYGHTLYTNLTNAVFFGSGNVISQSGDIILIGGYRNTTADQALASLIVGANNQFGGLWQLVSGQYLINRSPAGSFLGNSAVDFSSLAYTGRLSTIPSGIGGYPLFALGNSATNDGSVHSNAVTVLFNGRTQINTTGFSNPLAQAAVTPKAALEVVSSNSGVLLPKLTTAQRNAIVTADLQNGLLLYNIDSSVYQFYNGSAWSNMGAAGSGSGWGTSGNTATNPAGNFIGTTDTERLVFKTGGIEQMTILSGGAVGIGTSVLPATDARLAVNGVLYAKKVKVTQSGWPDYVFDKSYSLPGLASIERYIRQHRHLPGIISAGQAEAKGVDLGDNQAALLKEIEELTLYLIDARKKSEERQKEIDRLKEQNESLDAHQREIDQLMERLKK
jgi:hypothetical protein